MTMMLPLPAPRVHTVLRGGRRHRHCGLRIDRNEQPCLRLP
jgi:hypothetical protein